MYNLILLFTEKIHSKQEKKDMTFTQFNSDVLEVIFSSEMAQSYSWCGQRSKCSAQNLRIIQLIIGNNINKLY